ncbi:Bidirectional sugar transporter SWEET [Rhynchospora pubera]|uniref:Bidirectional sugar transporter SWEET n=1 Tax=Rhynchospora pubera TaxID=906938 RepID=A0AAV8DFM3_9POAL|nr:Bidirectional sugar transporter SWEET [Rhynchospora pubera]
MDFSVFIRLLGVLTSLLMFLSQWGTITKIMAARNSAEFNAAPFLAEFLNCLIGLLYGLPIVSPDNNVVLVVNAIGLLAESVYLMVFVVHSEMYTKIQVIATIFLELLAGGFIGLIFSELPFGYVRVHTASHLCVMIGILFLFGAPISDLTKAWKLKSIAHMPLLPCIGSFVNSFLWISYFCIRRNYPLVLLNAIGLLVGGLQVFTHYWFSHLAHPVVHVSDPAHDEQTLVPLNQESDS